MREYDYTVFIDLAKWYESKCNNSNNGNGFSYMMHDLKKHGFTQDEIEDLHITSNNFDDMLDPCDAKLWTKFNAYVISVFENYNTYDEMVESVRKISDKTFAVKRRY